MDRTVHLLPVTTHLTAAERLMPQPDVGSPALADFFRLKAEFQRTFQTDRGLVPRGLAGSERENDPTGLETATPQMA